jgi:hypothetical protein
MNMKKQIKINIFNIIIRSDYFQFGSVFIKKNNQIEIFKKKKPKPVQTDRFQLSSVF